MGAALKMVTVFVVLGIPAGLLLIPWTLLNGNIDLLYRAGQWIAGAGTRAAGIRIQQSGREQIPAGRACVFMANHVSNLDPPVLVPLLPGFPSIMLKAELMKLPVLGSAMRMARFVPVERDGGRHAAVRSARAAAEVLQSGRSLLVFPEGTRSRTGRLQPFKAGVFHLAQAGGAVIIPVVISGTETMLRKGSVRVYPGVARVQFLQPIDPAGYRSRTDLTDAVRDAMIGALPEKMRPVETGAPEAERPSI